MRNFFNLFRLTADYRVLLSGGDGFYYYGGAAVNGDGHPDYRRLERVIRQLFRVLAGGYSGHGVTVAVLAGRLLRALVAGEPLDPVYDFVLNRKPPRSPGEPLTSLGFGLGKRYMHWKDAR